MTAGIVLAGLGDIGLNAHLPALRRNPAARLVAVVDPDPARLAAAAAFTDAPAHQDLDRALADPDVHGVVLATPPWVTPRLIETVTAAGRYVLAEKPVATSVAAAAGLASLPAGQRDRVQVGLTYRHDPALARLRDWIAAGELGSPLLVRAHIYDEPRDAADPAHTDRILATLAHGLPVVHEGAHVLDWFSHLFGGPPTAIGDAWSVASRPDLPAANLCGARLDYPHGTVVLAEFGWLTESLPRCEISVLGDRAEVRLNGGTFRMHRRSARGVEEFTFEPDRTTRCFDLQLARFLDLIAGGAGPSPNLGDGLAVLELAERIAALAAGGVR